MSGKRINNSTISFHSGWEPELVFAIDRVDTGSGDWIQMRKLTLADVGNTYIQGSTNNVNWHDDITSSDNYLRITTDGEDTWVALDTDLISEGSNLYFTEARVLDVAGVQDAVDDSHTHSNKSILDNIIDTGDGNSFLSSDGTYTSNVFKVQVDSAASADFLGNTGADGVLRINDTYFDYDDGGNYVTIDLDDTIKTKLGYIDQDVKTTARPNFAGYSLTSGTAPTFEEGKVWYDSSKHGITYFSDVTDVQVNMGQEVLFRVTNNTGSTITNGTVVYPDESTVIGLADAYDKDKSRVIAVATHDIADGAEGWVTKFGQVGGLDTSAYSVAQVLYLGTNGQFATTSPDDGGYEIIVGIVDVVDAADGIITIDTNVSHLTVEVVDTNGFPNSTDTTLSFNDATRTLTITPTGSSFHYYQLGDKYSKDSAQSIVISDTTGENVIYFDGETLSEIVNPSDSQIEDIVRNKCIVSYLYWNSIQAASVIVNDERHGISMSPATHVYLHTTRGAQYLSGLAVSDIIIGNGSLASHAQFGVESGIIADEDLNHTLNAVVSTTGLKYLYRTGSGGDWNSGTNAGFSFPVGATPLPQYNEYTGTTWQLTELGSGDYMIVHLFATSDLPLNPISVIGIDSYSTIQGASDGIFNEISQILGTLAAPEFVPIASIIIEGKTSFTNSVNARIVQTTDGDDYIDWRTTELSAGSTATNHNTLSSLQLANTGVTWGHIDDQTQTIYGEKTFNTFPLTPSAAPDADYEVSNKKYVDDLVTPHISDSSIHAEEASTLEAIAGALDTVYITPKTLLQVLDLSWVPYYGAEDDLYMPDYEITSGDLTVTKSQTVNTTEVDAATYDLAVDDYILLVSYTSTGAVTSLTLPTAQVVNGRIIIIKDTGGNAGTNNITIDTEGSETIDGSATLVLSTDYESTTIVCDGTNWFTI